MSISPFKKYSDLSKPCAPKKTGVQFDLSALLDELPAAQFLWYNKVESSKQRDQYVCLLSKLIALFTAPHHFPIYPFKEASFFKLYQAHFNKIVNMDKLLPLLLDILAGNSARSGEQNVEFYYSSQDFQRDQQHMPMVLNDRTAEDLGTITLDSVLRPWLETSDKPVFITLLRIENRLRTGGHSTLLVLKKSDTAVKYIYVNPWGFKDNTNFGVEHDPKLLYFSLMLHNRLYNLVGRKRLIKVVPTCPELQEKEQGGNCNQWTCMLVVALTMNPELFDSFSDFLKQLGRHPSLNILLFSLSVFLRTMPKIGLEKYYYSMFLYARAQRERHFDVNAEYLFEHNVFNNKLYNYFGQVNCDNYSPHNCEAPCQRCAGVCAIDELVSHDASAAGACHVLSSKAIAKKLFKTYFKLKKLTNMMGDSKSFMLKQMKAVLDSVEEIASVQNYEELQLLAEQDMELVRGMEQSQNEEEQKEEPTASKKRTRDLQEDDSMRFKLQKL
jgi:hypothetical protein